MTDLETKNAFLDAAETWLCDGYSCDIRFLTERNGSDLCVADATIVLGPISGEASEGFAVEACGFLIGQTQGLALRKTRLLELLRSATDGVIEIQAGTFRVDSERLTYHSELPHQEKWFSELNIRVGGGNRRSLSYQESASVDSALRRGVPPFDGLRDAARWLGLAEYSGSGAGIVIKVLPPVDLIYAKSWLANDVLGVTLHAHENFDTSLVGLAVCGMPGDTLSSSRRQVANEIEWSEPQSGTKVGVARITLRNADSALTMLSIGRSTVRRQWFSDPQKARNAQLLAVQAFDRDLKMVRGAVMESPDSTRFELGVAALLYIQGFSPSVQLETDAPDVIVSTPAGRLVLVECTTRIADFNAKLGKLVDRRGALQKALQGSGHPADVVSVLVCRLPRAQIAVDERELRAKKVVLYSGEDLSGWFEQGRFRTDPDQMISDALDGLRDPEDLFSA